MPETLTLQEKIKALPTQPGVYLFKDKTGDIIYIGKAKVLRNRVRSYFHSADSKDFKTRKMVPKITDLDWIVLPTEIEALVAEQDLVTRILLQLERTIGRAEAIRVQTLTSRGLKTTISSMYRRLLPDAPSYTVTGAGGGKPSVAGIDSRMSSWIASSVAAYSPSPKWYHRSAPPRPHRKSDGHPSQP